MTNIENLETTKSKVLVTGATGMQGGAAIRALLREGYPVTAFVRDASSPSAQALVEQGAALATGDLNDLASLEAASAGHDAVFSVQLSGAHPDNPGAELRQARNLVKAAKQAGVKQIVHTSVSATGWRDHNSDLKLGELITAYWDEKKQPKRKYVSLVSTGGLLSNLHFTWIISFQSKKMPCIQSFLTAN